MTSTSNGNWVVGIDALHGNPYDGKTLKEAHKQVEKLTGEKVEEIFVDKGYKGATHHPEGVSVYLSGRKLKGRLNCPGDRGLSSNWTKSGYSPNKCKIVPQRN